MHISNILYKPVFGTSYYKAYMPDKPFLIDHEASTCAFKKDFLWNKSFDFFIDYYKDTDKVNVYSLASSDCSEALSIAMMLDTKLGTEECQKYFPVIAVDNDANVLTNIRNGYIDLSLDDEVRINHYTNNNLNKYLIRTDYTHISDRIGDTDKRVLLTRFRINPTLLVAINVKNDDVRDYVKSMPDKNNLVFCRNMWIYLHPEQAKFLEQLSQKCDKKSFLVTGDYDFLMCPLSMKNSNGFSMHPELLNVYDKSGSDYFDDMRWLTKANFNDY